ncbi:hypothetical protein HZS_3638 [Henneguya salminicola]|nr:hypothetical protein HZS_3638 [Henneguya salminicola]
MRDQFVHTPYSLQSKNQVYSAIREQQVLSGINSIEAAMSPPLSLLPKNQPYFRRYWVRDIHGVQHKIMIGATNPSLSLLRYNGHTFVDGTFRTTLSRPFYQCLIIMVFDQANYLFIPYVFGLMTVKNEHIYCECLHPVIMLLKYNWMPKIVTMDFEKALISATNHEFPESRVLECYFHFKQALHRKLKKCRVSSTNSDIILSKMELFTIIQIVQINQAIGYIQSLTTAKDTLNQFWGYFNRTWMVRFSQVYEISQLEWGIEQAMPLNVIIED